MLLSHARILQSSFVIYWDVWSPEHFWQLKEWIHLDNSENPVLDASSSFLFLEEMTHWKEYNTFTFILGFTFQLVHLCDLLLRTAKKHIFFAWCNFPRKLWYYWGHQKYFLIHNEELIYVVSACGHVNTSCDVRKSHFVLIETDFAWSYVKSNKEPFSKSTV